jgi:hypothetical protein
VAHSSWRTKSSRRIEDRAVDQPLDKAGCCLVWMSLERAAAVCAFVVEAQYQTVSAVACVSGSVAYPYPYF